MREGSSVLWQQHGTELGVADWQDRAIAAPAVLDGTRVYRVAVGSGGCQVGRPDLTVSISFYSNIFQSGLN
jgi:hypothetical protein